MNKNRTRFLALLLALVMVLGLLPAMAAEAELAETELNKLVGYYATTADPERQGAVTPAGQVVDQTQSVTLDAAAGMLSLDFGYAAYVTRVELTSANTGSDLTGDDFEVWLGTENFGKVKFLEDGSNERRAQLGKLSKQDYTVTSEVRDGHDVLQFRFSDNAAGRYLVLQLKNPRKAPTFVLEQLGRDVRVFGALAVVGDASVEAAEIRIRPDTVVGDGALPQLGENAYKALDRKDASLTLDMGRMLAVSRITLRAADAAAEIPADAVALYLSDDGEHFRMASGVTMTQAVKDGRRELYFDAAELLQGRYFKLCYTVDGTEAFEILNTEEDILVSYDPFGLPGSDPERREPYSIAVSAAYFDSRLAGEYGQEALDKRNELSVEDFVIWYLDNLNSNFNYLYRWENIGESVAADNKNISTAVKLPAKGPVDQIAVTATGKVNVRLLPEDWIVSWSNDDRNFTVIDHDTMTFREEIIDGKRVHLIDFPEIEAKTFLVYNTYTKNFVDLPSGKQWFVITTNQASFAAYNKVDDSTRYVAAPVAVEGRTGDPASVEALKTQLLLELEETAAVSAVTLASRTGETLNADDFTLKLWDEASGLWIEPQWSAAQKGNDHVFTVEETETRYILLQYNGAVTVNDYFAENYSGYTVSVAMAGEPQSLADGLSKAGFAYNAGYITGSNGLTAAELWELIAAEPDPVSAYQVALENGLSIGWTYRITDQYVLDTPQLRQSIIYYWPEVQTLNRLTIASNQTRQDIRVTEDDFYVSYSTDNFATCRLLEPADLTVTKYQTDGGCPAFTIDLPETVQASHVIVYTTYSLGELTDPTQQGYYYYIIKPGDTNNNAFYVPNTKDVTPKATTLATGKDPMGGSMTDLLLDLGEAVPVTHVNLTPVEGTSFVAADYEVLIRENDSWTAAAWTEENGVLTLSETAETRYVLLRYKGAYAGAGYFTESFTDITVTLAATGETVSLNDGLTGRTFAPGAGYLPPQVDQAAVWAAIHAEPDPVKGYQVALENGVSIGWAYRTSSRTAVDHHAVRQSMMLYWAAEKTLNRIYIPTDNSAVNLRVDTDDFYVAYSSNNFTTYSTLYPEDLTVTKGATAEGYPSFTIELPEITASHVIVYTTYNLEVLSNPADTGHSYFIVVPTQIQVSRVPAARKVTPALTTLESGRDPFSQEEAPAEEGSVFALDRTGRSVGFENPDGRPMDLFLILGTGTVSADKADYRLFVSGNNADWNELTDFSLSVGEFSGKTALRVDAETDAAFVKLTYTGETVGGFRIDDVRSSVKAYALDQISDYSYLYEKAASIGYAEGDRTPAKGIANSFGSSEAFTFDTNYRSLVADLGEAAPVNYIRLYDDDGQTRLVKQDLSIYVSDDNVTYTKVDDFDFRQEGRVLHLYNFTAAARYVKVHQNFFETSSAFRDEENKPTDEPIDYYATVKGSLQDMMSVYQVPLFSVYADADAYPYGQGQWPYYRELTLKGAGELVLLTYEELGLPELAAEGKVRADYADVRFTTAEGVLLHCYDSGDGFYVRAGDNETILMFYGVPDAASVSDGAGTLQVDYGGKTYGKALGGDVHMAMLPDGRMIQIAHRGLENGEGDEVFMAVSNDNGLNWGEPVQLSFTPNHDAQAGGVTVLQDGTVMVTYMWLEKNGGYGSYLDPEKTNMPAYAIYSKDLENWTEPVQVSADYTYNLTTTNPTQAANGDIYVPFCCAVDDHGSVGIYVNRSRDGGKTWENVSGLYTDDSGYFEGGYSEPCAVELEEGTIRIYFRQGAGPEVNKLGQITSYDNGETWSEATQSQFYATCTQPVTYKLDSGRILLMWAGHNGTGSNTYQRMPVTVVYSDDNGDTWHGYQEVSGRTLINIPFGHPMALQPDFCYAPAGSLTWMIWVRGSIYAPDGSWVSIRLEDFDRWMEENTGAFDDFEQASVIKGNYWYEMGPRVGISEEYAVSGTRALRIKDSSTIDTALATRNFMGVKKGEVHVSLNFTSAASGLRLGLWECEPVHAEDFGNMFALDISKSGELRWVNGDGEAVSTGVSLKLGQWYDLTMKFDVEAGTMEILVDGETAATAACTAQQSVISYFTAYSTGVAETGTEFWLDDLYVIDSEDADLQLAEISGEQVPGEKPVLFELAGASMTLNSDLTMNFFVKQTDAAEGMYAEILRDGETTVIPLADWNANGELYQIPYPGFAAKEMTDEVTVTVYDAAGNPVSQVWKDSIRAYAMRMIRKDDTEAALKTTLVDMLNYGAEAQVFFDYNTGDLANSLLTDEEKALAAASVEMKDIRVKADGYIGSALELEHRILLKFVFDGSFVGKTAEVTYTDHYGKPVTGRYELVQNGSFAVFSVETLAVADCSVPVTVTVDGVTVTDSVESYCARMQQTLPLAEPLMKFAASANAYFK